MAASVTTPAFPAVENIQVLTSSKKEANVARGVDRLLMTHAPTSDAIEAVTFLTRCWNAVKGVASSIWRVVSVIIIRVWGCMSSPFRCIKSKEIKVAESLRAFNQLIDVHNNLCSQCSKEKAKTIEAQLRIAYDVLPYPLQRTLNSRIQELKHQLSKEASVVNIICESSSDMGITTIVDSIYRDLPSVILSDLATQLSKEEVDVIRLDIFHMITRVATSDSEPDVTDDVINVHVFAAFEILPLSLREMLCEYIRNARCFDETEGLVDCEGKLSLMINENRVSLTDPDFPLLILKNMPRSPRVIDAIHNCSSNIFSDIGAEAASIPCAKGV